MKTLRFDLWRLCFILSAVLMMAGGPRHPRGTMAQMLAHPDWVVAHAFLLAGFVALLVGLIVYQQNPALPERVRKCARIAVIATVLQTIEMAFHTASAVDHANLVAGRATPILTSHLWLAVAIYPVFGLTVAGLIVAGVRDGVLGSRWIAWLGILGLLAHGAAAPLVIVFQVQGAEMLFPMLLLFAIWMVLAAFWPLRAMVGHSSVLATDTMNQSEAVPL
jgi:hypothetical protein